MAISNVSDLNQQILGLWQEHYKNKAGVLAPIFYPELKRNGLLFIGLNPSFSPGGFKSILKDTPQKYIADDLETFYSFKNWNNEKMQESIIADEHALNKYSYFNIFRNISKETNTDWAHLDLFFCRCTNQSDIKDKIFRDIENYELEEIAGKQLKLSFEAIKFINPKVIIVANALASGILNKHYCGLIHFDHSKGFDLLSVGDKKIPIFFSSMLTGVRALDTHSRKRLIWHIKQALR